MGYFILILSIIFLFFFCLFLTISNQKLSNKIKELKYELDTKIITTNDTNLFNTNKIPINEISNELEIDNKKKEDQNNINNNPINEISINSEEKKEHIEQNDTNHDNKLKVDINKEDILENNPKYKNLIYLDEPNEEVEKGDEVIMIKEENLMNLNDFIRKNNILEETELVTNIDIKEDIKTSIKDNNTNITSQNNNISFLENISKQMEEQIEPQTIELTDYEKEQEENAIISYKEFLKVKDELYEINAAKENDEFIQDLKNFRNNLN